MPDQSSATRNPAETTPHLTRPNELVQAFRNKNGVRASAIINPEFRKVDLIFGTEDFSFYQSLKMTPEDAAALGRLLIEGAAFFGVTQ